MIDRWQKQVEGILIFVSPNVGILYFYALKLEPGTLQAGLFSAVVATLLSVTLPDLKPNPLGSTEFYLNNICQSLSSERFMSTSLPSRECFHVLSFQFSHMGEFTLDFERTNQSYLRNVGDTRTKTSTLIHQDRAVVAVQSTHKRARLRAFFSDSVNKKHVSWALELSTTLLHISFFLFLTGVLIYLFNICPAAFAAVFWWVVLSMVAYLTITLPNFRPNSPYYALLPSPIWYIFATIRYTVFKVLSSPVVR